MDDAENSGASGRPGKPGRPLPGVVLPPQAGFRLLRRLVAYHLALAFALAAMVMLVPGVVPLLPVGGLSELAVVAGSAPAGAGAPASADARAGATDAATPLLPGAAFDRLGYARRLVIAVAGVWLLMLPVSWVHKGIYRSSGYDHSLDETTLILPGVVAGIVLVVQYSLALAFALAGIVAGVQFRRALQDTFDALFILVAIGAGIAAGVAALEVAAVMSVFFCYATLYVCCFGDGLQSDFLADRKLRKRRRLRRAGDPEVGPPRDGGG